MLWIALVFDPTKTAEGWRQCVLGGRGVFLCSVRGITGKTKKVRLIKILPDLFHSLLQPERLNPLEQLFDIHSLLDLLQPSIPFD